MQSHRQNFHAVAVAGPRPVAYEGGGKAKASFPHRSASASAHDVPMPTRMATYPVMRAIGSSSVSSAKNMAHSTAHANQLPASHRSAVLLSGVFCTVQTPAYTAVMATNAEYQPSARPPALAYWLYATHR